MRKQICGQKLVQFELTRYVSDRKSFGDDTFDFHGKFI